VVDVREVYRRLLRRFGPQGWWPGDTPFEVVVGALLMAQTAWANVERALANLKDAGLLDPHALASVPLDRLGRLIRPAGLYGSKPRRLRGLCRHLVAAADGDLARFFARPGEEVRRDLLAREGVGPETADSILLYAAGVPTFVVDAYTRRLFERLGAFRGLGYDGMKAFFEDALPPDVETYREYHALIVAHGKGVCRPRPRCHACPLTDLCAYYADLGAKGKV
jgi:endonuclease-3 related protein